MGAVLRTTATGVLRAGADSVDKWHAVCYILIVTGCDEDTGAGQAAQRGIRFGERILRNLWALTTSEPSAQIADRVRPLKRQ